jgi:dolichol-phosphate mannosyltransferase
LPYADLRELLDPAKRPQRRWLVIAAGLLAATLLLRVAVMSNLVLMPEEAYYWMYARHLNWGYFDHPPMVAWLIRAGTAVFGNTEFGVRFVSDVLMLAASGVMYAFARRWYGRGVSLVAALLLQILPAYAGVGFIATMESALTFFWLVCLLGVSIALRQGRWWGWYVAGLGLGGAMLSKYTGVFLAFGTFAAVIAHKPWRRQLRSPHPYLAFLMASGMFAPVVVWNARHDWASFRFQFIDRYQEQAFDIGSAGEYLLGVVLVLTPLPFVLLARATGRAVRCPGGTRRWHHRPRAVFTACAAAPMVLVLAYKSLRYDVHFNWVMAALLPLLPLAVHAAVAGARVRRMRARRDGRARGPDWALGLRATVMICLAFNVGGAFYLLVVEPRVKGLEAFGPWRELALQVQQHADELQRQTGGREPLVIADGTYRLASVLAFYRQPLERDVDASRYTTSRWILGGSGLGFEYWTDRRDFEARDCVFVREAPEISSRVATCFESFRVVADPELADLHDRTYSVAIGYHLRSRPPTAATTPASPSKVALLNASK